jgi:hypothetical protein
MTDRKPRELTFVVYRDLHRGEAPTEHRVALPEDAGFPELLSELKHVAPAVYEALRAQILRSASQVLAFGETDDFVPLMLSELVDGSRIVLSMDEPAESPVLALSET